MKFCTLLFTMLTSIIVIAQNETYIDQKIPTENKTASSISSVEIKEKASINSLETTVSSSVSFDGTYQFLLIDNRKPILSQDIISFVNANRNQSEDVIINYSENIQVFIPSANSIAEDSFEDLPLYK